jgi:two-component system sensor histidine kinase KdpD
VDELVSRALEALGAEAERVSVELEVESAPVRVDAAQIERVLVNVLENALRLSSPSDPVELAVTREDDEILIRISDRGPGLASDDSERIFQPFEHGSGTRQGTGLGLAIARGFAAANGARLWAEPRPGSGASFVLALPAEQAPVRA